MIHTLRGKLGAFQQVKPRDLAGGEATLAELIVGGFVVKGSR
jgi:hypothetical protein